MQQGFSLLELSIVLVIIGLLSGGILGGQSLIKAAELRSVSTQTQSYMTAVRSFQDKYFALPGDMTNATSFWSAADATPSTCYTTASNSPLTCNGNGDGQVNSADSGTTFSERFRFWQHLANAGLIEGSFNGIAGGGGSAPKEQPVITGANQNVPSSTISSGGFSVFYANVPLGDVNWFAGSVGNFYSFGANNGNNMSAPLLKTEDAWNIDTKLDDGRAGTGLIMTYTSTNTSVPNCATTAVAATAQYNLIHTGQDCSLLIKTGF